MALSPDEFWDMEPREFRAAYQGYNKRMEATIKNNYEAARLVMLAITQVHAPKGKRFKPQDIIAFPWDSEGKPKEPLSPEEVYTIMSLF